MTLLSTVNIETAYRQTGAMRSSNTKYKSSLLNSTTYMWFFLLPGPPYDQILYNRTIILLDNAFGNYAYRYFLANLEMSAH